jgi:actin-related protein
MVCESAFKCDRDQQAHLLGNSVLCGGGACLSTSVLSTSIGISDGNAFPERLREEVEALIHTHTPGWRVKVLSPGISERHICSWLGASILGSLGSFHDMWITKAEYEEHGPSIVNRKCP